MNRIRKLCLDFLWNNKNYKIKDIYLQRDYVDGGIKLMDIKTQIMSLKLRWIGRILDGSNASWKHMPKLQFSKIGGLPLCLNYNLSQEHTKDINRMSPFYDEIFKGWCTLRHKAEHNHTVQDSHDILNQIIWNNSCITYAKKPLFFKEWIRAGFITVRDIMTDSGFISFHQVQRELNSRAARATCFFDLEKVKMCLKKSWRNLFSGVNLDDSVNDENNMVPPLVTIKGKSYQIYELKTKTFYEILQENNTIESRVEIYWQNKIINNPIGQNGLDWNKIWKFKLKSIKDIRFKNFNVKFLYNLVPVNANLYKWKLLNNDACTVCNVKEDIVHGFLLCQNLKPFWDWL